MKKQSYIGIGAMVVLFVAFAYFTSRDQQKYQREMAAYEAYRDSVEAATRPIVTMADSLAAADPAAAAAAEQQRRVAELGEHLAAARTGEVRSFTVENDVMTVGFSTQGGRIESVTLKDYTRYAPRGERNEPVTLFDPATARFDLSFYVKNGFNNVPVHTMDYCFTLDTLCRVQTPEGPATSVVMSLPVADDASLKYEYLVYDGESPARDYLVDFDVRLENLAPRMAAQSTIGIDWSNTSYQNEKGFQNENMYTTLSYRLPGESSIEDLGMSEKSEKKHVDEPLSWVAFKQQFFSSVFIAPELLSEASLAFDTAEPGTGYMKDYSAQMTVPYTLQTEGYDFSFYFGPNKYAILNKVTDPSGEELHLERLIPLGWGIFGWVNRWFVIPVFDFLSHYIGSFGIIILILAVLVKIIISPLTYKSYVSTAKMRVIKPEVDELAKKYPKQEDAMKRQQATMELYKKAGINPMGGCIPLLIQMPIIIAMFRFFPASIELREQPFLWADDLSAYDSILDLPFKIPFYGDHVSLFALLMAAALFFYSYVNYQQTAAGQPQMAGMKFVMVYLMPVMLLLWFNNYSSGLCFYYFLTNILTIGQTYVIRRMIDDEKIHALMKANAARRNNGKKSKFQLKYEELMRQQEEMQRQQQQRTRRR